MTATDPSNPGPIDVSGIADPSEKAALQTHRLRDLVGRLAGSGNPFWAERLAGIDPDDIDSLDALPDLPFTVKQDLRDTYPTGMLVQPLDDTIRLHASSGTSGKPTIVCYSRDDIAI